MHFHLGQQSLSELNGVHPDMVRVVKRAIQISTQDFTVYDGARTLEEQKEFVRRGVSKTMRSRHLVQKDGYGHAVDLVPWINGQARWEWGAIWPIAVSMAKASKELQIEIIWGGVWDRKMSSYKSGSVAGLKAAVEDYKERHSGADFLDGPHFQLA